MKKKFMIFLLLITISKIILAGFGQEPPKLNADFSNFNDRNLLLLIEAKSKWYTGPNPGDQTVRLIKKMYFEIRNDKNNNSNNNTITATGIFQILSIVNDKEIK